MDENDDIIEDEHPAEKRIRDRETRDLKAENTVLRAVPGLNDDQRETLALLAAKGGLDEEAIKAKAEALGFLKPEVVEETPEVPAATVADERIAAAAYGSVPPPPPVAPILDVRQRIVNAPAWNPVVADRLRQEWDQAFRAAGGEYVEVDHNGTFSPA